MTFSRKFIESSLLYMEIASTVSKFSKAKRRQVGAVIVSLDGKIIGTGFNGTPAGVDNCCENDNNETHSYVIHSEINAILNSTTHKLDGSTIYITLSPCMGCSSTILQKKIKTVVYDEPYRDMSGVIFLQNHGVNVVSILELQSLKDISDRI